MDKECAYVHSFGTTEDECMRKMKCQSALVACKLPFPLISQASSFSPHLFLSRKKKRNSHHSSQVPSYLACCTPLSYTIPPFLLVLAEAVALPHNICSFFNRPREFRQTACSVTWQRLSQTANRSPQLRPHQPHHVVACPDLPWYMLCVW